jgi:hypothetical protein
MAGAAHENSERALLVLEVVWIGGSEVRVVAREGDIQALCLGEPAN